MDKKRTLAITVLLFVAIIFYILLRATALTPSEVLDKETRVEITPITDELEIEFESSDSEEVVINPSPVEPKPPVVAAPTPVALKRCYVGGCSRQLCTDSLDIVSTCEWRESYACYQAATCERQATGECGWTETPALNSCLLEAKSNTTITF